MPTAAEGIVYLVGAGPGDPGLFTLKGLDVLRKAEVVIYDGLVNPEILNYAPASAELISADKHDRSACVSQDQINAQLLAKAREGKRVVRLKGGDPFIFGRGGEESEMLAMAGIPFEIVPGVSSSSAVPAYSGIPLTHRRYNSSVTIVTGHECANNKVDWDAMAKVPGTLVVMMGLRHFRSIASRLIEGGRDPGVPAAAITHGTTGAQRTVTGTLCSLAARIEEASLESPVVIVIGEVVRLRDRLAWFDCDKGLRQDHKLAGMLD